MDLLIELMGLEQGMLRGFVFGVVHVGILIIGYYTGWSINRLLKKTSNAVLLFILNILNTYFFSLVNDFS